MLMVWDEPKREANLAKHGLDFADARERFEWQTALVEVTKPGRGGSARYLAVGFLDGQLVALVFGLLGTEAVSAISLRRASRAERSRYDEA
ncbi:BrnT family toxin [Methylobacterium dankookense]|nr:BrnT family toxin [Methylobacterium dankookense]